MRIFLYNLCFICHFCHIPHLNWSQLAMTRHVSSLILYIIYLLIVWRRKVAPWRYLGSFCVKHYCLVQIYLFEWIVTGDVLSMSTTFCVTVLHNVLVAMLHTVYCVRVSRQWWDFISACLWIIIHLIFLVDHLMIIF